MQGNVRAETEVAVGLVSVATVTVRALYVSRSRVLQDTETGRVPSLGDAPRDVANGV